MSEWLKPCPFCGAEAHLRKDKTHSTAYFFGCVDEECAGYMLWDFSKRAALKKWNTRADLSDGLLREAMEALIGVIPTHRFVGNFCWCPAARDADAGHTADCLKARATLAKLRAHLEGEKE